MLMQKQITLETDSPATEGAGLVLKDQVITRFPNVPSSRSKNLHETWSCERLFSLHNSLGDSQLGVPSDSNGSPASNGEGAIKEKMISRFK